MTTFREIVYAVLDILKEHSDDAYYTEEHVMFLAEKMRALLLERKYHATRNSSFIPVSDENKQLICLDLEKDETFPAGCDGPWVKSVQKIPDTLDITEPKLSVSNGMIYTPLTYIPAERMPYVGYNKWLRNIIYAAKGPDGYLYLKSWNSQFLFLERAKMEAVFSDVEEAQKLSCEDEAGKCELLDAEFPLEQSLVSSCIEMVVQELLGSRYAPEDKSNNAKDDLGTLSVSAPKASKPASRTEQQQEAAE